MYVGDFILFFSARAHHTYYIYLSDWSLNKHINIKLRWSKNFDIPKKKKKTFKHTYDTYEEASFFITLLTILYIILTGI